MLTIQGVQASIVLYRQGDGVSISARSMEGINVQVLLESLGGGGNATAAGCYVPNSDLETVRRRVIAAVNEYYATDISRK